MYNCPCKARVSCVAQDGVRYHRVERNEGSFRRTVTLPDGVDPSKILCTFQNGVLTVRIPKPHADENLEEFIVNIVPPLD